MMPRPWPCRSILNRKHDLNRLTSTIEVTSMDKNDECKPCPEGQVRRDGKCVMPEVTFAAFIISLNTSALFHLGEISDPVSGEKQQDLVLAKHTIDTIQLLEKKTRGNLTDEEKDIIENVLYDLKMSHQGVCAIE